MVHINFRNQSAVNTLYQLPRYHLQLDFFLFFRVTNKVCVKVSRRNGTRIIGGTLRLIGHIYILRCGVAL